MNILKYSNNTKKGLVAYLLLVSCIISALILVYLPTPPQTLESFAQADSLILDNLQNFNVEPAQIHTSVLRVDSIFSRKTFTVQVSPGFSKTQLHAELNRAFHPLSVETPARVFLTENSMLINLLYRGTVFRRISLRTDPDLTLEQNYASILIAFDTSPSERLLNEIIRFGEPIYLALQATDREQARALYSQTAERYSLLSFWLQNPDQASRLLPPLSLLSEFNPGAPVLSFINLSSTAAGVSDSFAQTARSEGLKFIDVSRAQILDIAQGEQLYEQGLSNFEEKFRTQIHPILIVRADAEALARLRERLEEWKRGGLILAPPPETTF